jgi:hypothetical protein
MADWPVWIVPGVLGLLGVLLFLRGVTSLGRKPLSGAFGALTGGTFMALGAATGLLGLNFLTYNRLSHEQQVAEVTFRQTGPSAFVADMKLPDGTAQKCYLADDSGDGTCAILGDEWQVDARVLKWKPWANVAGLDANYRLERMAGRYHDINAERSAPRSVYQLNSNPGLDLWAIAQKYAKYAPVVDAQYGSATYIPMADGATYYVTMSQTGLLARPANDQARTAVQGWK